MGNPTRQTTKFLIENREEREVECVYVYGYEENVEFKGFLRRPIN